MRKTLHLAYLYYSLIYSAGRHFSSFFVNYFLDTFERKIVNQVNFVNKQFSAISSNLNSHEFLSPFLSKHVVSESQEGNPI